MNSNFIQGLQIDWSRIAEESYLRDIPALRNLTELSFTHPVTCLVGENGTGKSTLLEAIPWLRASIPRAARAISGFPPMILIPSYAARCG